MSDELQAVGTRKDNSIPVLFILAATFCALLLVNISLSDRNSPGEQYCWAEFVEVDLTGNECVVFDEFGHNETVPCEEVMMAEYREVRCD